MFGTFAADPVGLEPSISTVNDLCLLLEIVKHNALVC